MALALTEEQEILQRTAREFVQGKSSFKRIRALRDDATGDGLLAASCGARWRSSAGSASSCPRSTAAPGSAGPT